MVAPKRKTAASGGPASERGRRDDGLSATLAQAAWEQADEALAQALIEFEVATTAKTSRARAQALELLGQALSRAARRRGFNRLGTLGRREPFDPDRHQLNRVAAKPPKVVRVVARGVARAGNVLVRAQVLAERAP